MNIRPARPHDRPFLDAMIRECGAFTGIEEETAMELIDHHINCTDTDYTVVCATDNEDTPTGYLCYGPTPLADAVYDLYWIVVSPLSQKKGIGLLLLRWLENELKKRGARLLLIETASKDSYAGQRAFYDKCGFVETARITDFYAEGDDKLIYEKRFKE